MMFFHADFDRRIDLPGAGPCARPIDIDRARTGFDDLVSLRVYSFVQGMEIDGEAEEDEVFIALLRGAADVSVSSDGAVTDASLRRHGGALAVYMPPGASYRLNAVGDCDIAYARVRSAGDHLPLPKSFAATDDRIDIVGYAKGMDLALAAIGATDTVEPGEPLLERFVHVRSDDRGIVTMAGQRLGDWDAAAIGKGERVSLQGQSGSIDVLIVTASQRRSETSQGVIRGNG